MRLVGPFVAALATSLLVLATQSASAKLLIEIDKSAQRMIVSEDGAQLYVWPVSTGISRYDTPAGSFKPFRMERDHFSREWDNAPMPNSIFFTQRGHAIHGTNHTSIGRPASHGCVRLSVAHSQVLFELVRREGMANTRVELFGEIPVGTAPEVARAPQYGQPNYGSGYQRGNEDDDMTGSVPQRGVLPSYPRDDRQVYRGRYSETPPRYDERDVPFRRLPPPPFFFPGPRPGWN